MQAEKLHLHQSSSYGALTEAGLTRPRVLPQSREGYENNSSRPSKKEAKPNYIVFKVGEHPRLPFDGDKFFLFSSKTSSSHTKGRE